ncbi:MAG: hypothetical protein NTW03_00995 [Verrucomicrobia bacterium]|nr:hypothetical protein [Verrucomicrobiota bacterium]
MTKILALVLGLFLSVSARAAEVLIVADEFPAMEVLAGKLKAELGVSSSIVWQTNLPSALAPFSAVILYVHKDLYEPAGDVSQGGYKWIEPARLEVVKLSPGHFITTHEVKYPGTIRWQPAKGQAGEQVLPGFVLEDSEVYINHVLLGEHTPLLGFRYLEPKSGTVYCQSHAGWIRPSGQGWIVYLMPGHSARDFEEPAYARIVANAVAWKP